MGQYTSRSIQKRILLIDDEPAACGEFRRILGCPGQTDRGGAGVADDPSAPHPDTWPILQGLQVDSARRGEEGLDFARLAIGQRQPYALVVVALEMSSGEDGLETVCRLWEMDPELLVLLCADPAGNARRQIVHRLRRLEQCLFLPKPLDPLETCQLVASQLHRRGVQDELHQCSSALDSTRREMERTREEAEAVDRARTEFLANISHEIRTPMNAILGFSRLLTKEPLRADQLEKLGYIRDAGESLLGLIDNVLDFSRLAAGELKLNTVVFNLESVIREALEATRQSANNKGIALRYHVEQAVPRSLQGDGVRLRQILLNLVNNAIKFTEQGTIHVSTTLDEETDITATLRVVITDTGVGIPADRQAVIFDSFSQADGSATRQFGGLGLGLTICKRLVDLMSGQIGFRSDGGDGSSFWISVTFKKHSSGDHETCPVTSAEGTITPPDDSSGEPGDGQHGPRHGKPHVLVAEDDHLNRTLLEVLLTRAGCIVDLVRNGEEALAVAQKNRYDVILMDVQMPKMNGLEATEQIRKKEATTGRRVPIVALTANTLPDDRQRCLRAGADDYVAKPFSPDDLFAAVQRHIPGLLESSEQESSLEQSAASDELPDQPCSPADCLSALYEALECRDCRNLENLARTLKKLAVEAESKTLADHAMRIQLAARGGDLDRVAAAIQRLDQALHSADDGPQNENIAPSLPLSEGASS